MGKFNIDTSMPSIGLNLSSDPLSFKEGEYSFMLNGIMHGLDGKQPFARIYPGNVIAAALTNGQYPICNIPINHREVCVFSINPGFGAGEIGIFDGQNYRMVVRSVKLKFRITKQIQAVIDEDFNGHTIVIFVQEDMPIRYLDLNDPPMINGELDIDALEVFKKYSYPNVKFGEVTTNGRILSGSLYATIQYADENGNGLTSWSTPVGPAFIYRDAISQPKNFINGSADREQTGKAIRLEMSNLDSSFRYYNIGIIKSFQGIREPVIVQTLPVLQTSYLYTGNPDTERAVTLEEIITPAVSYISAKTIARSNGTVMIGNLKGRKEYNLQPFISQIQALWQCSKEKYDTADKTYANPTSGAYMMCLRRNEIYAFGVVIRWTDGTKSRVYPLIPREVNKYSNGTVINKSVDQFNQPIPAGEWDTTAPAVNDDISESGGNMQRYKFFNTAFVTGTDIQGDTGAEKYGEFGYWESTEHYPNDPDVYGINAGKNIRHFMAPDFSVAPITDGENMFHTDKDDSYIFKLGLRFPNIEDVFVSLPDDIKEQIQGWEIVRGDRRNNRTVTASGLLYNMWYQNWKETPALLGGFLPGPFNTDNAEDDIRLYQNYPLNDLRPDPFIDKVKLLSENAVTGSQDRYRKDIFSFVSPDTEFDRTGLLNGNLYLHAEMYGVARNNVQMMSPYPRMKYNTQDDDFRDLFYHMVSVGFYNNWKLNIPGRLRRKLNEAMYIPFNAQISGGNTGIPVHNRMQQGSVLLQVNKEIPDPTISDTSRSKISDEDFGCTASPDPRYRVASAYYASIINRIDNQYGGVFDTRYISTNLDNTNVQNNRLVFAGDTFIGRYAAKRQMVFYQNVKAYLSFPDGSRGVDLKSSYNIAGTKYYYTSVPKWIADNSNSECEPNGNGTNKIPMIQTGIPFFFTESDHNMDLQLNGTEEYSTFYPNLKDGSLSVFKWAGVEYIDKPNEHLVNKSYEEPNDLFGYQGPDPFFDANKINLQRYPTRVAYSLTATPENRVNNLLIFLPLNYYDFRRDTGELWDIRDIGNNRILFRTQHALYVDNKYATVPIENGKLILGTGKLFETEPQMIVKDDGGYMGTSAQWAFNSTPFGSFFIDPVRGSVFQFGESPNDISANDADSHFSEHLPLKLLKDFPWFQEFDNPANPEGIGFHSVYDYDNKLWILTKRDYEVIDKETISHFAYVNSKLSLNGFPVSLQDEKLFIDRSFTFCYSPAAQRWSGWQSFIPTSYAILQKRFFSFEDGSFWEHGRGLPRTYYGKRYPFVFESVIRSKNGESMTYTCNWITRAFPIKNSAQQGESFLQTFNKGIFYNEHQSTGVVKLTIQDENDLSTILDPEEITSSYIERYLRRRERFWQVDELYDMVRDHNVPFFSTDSPDFQNMYFMDKVIRNSNIDYFRDYKEAAYLNDLWMKYRLIYDKEEDIQLFLYLALQVSEQVII